MFIQELLCKCGDICLQRDYYEDVDPYFRTYRDRIGRSSFEVSKYQLASLLQNSSVDIGKKFYRTRRNHYYNQPTEWNLCGRDDRNLTRGQWILIIVTIIAIVLLRCDLLLILFGVQNLLLALCKRLVPLASIMFFIGVGYITMIFSPVDPTRRRVFWSHLFQTSALIYGTSFVFLIFATWLSIQADKLFQSFFPKFIQWFPMIFTALPLLDYILFCGTREDINLQRRILGILLGVFAISTVPTCLLLLPILNWLC